MYSLDSVKCLVYGDIAIFQYETILKLSPVVAIILDFRSAQNRLFVSDHTKYCPALFAFECLSNFREE